MSDNTGVVFQGRARLNEKAVADALKKFFRSPALFQCGDCNGDEFWIYADTDKRSGVIMIQCKNPNCRKAVPPVEMRAIQANDDILAKHGIQLPDPWLSSAPRGSDPSPAEVRRILMGEDDDD